MLPFLIVSFCVWQKASDRTWHRAYVTLQGEEMHYYSDNQMLVCYLLLFWLLFKYLLYQYKVTRCMIYRIVQTKSTEFREW